jgi:hypothetical protein
MAVTWTPYANFTSLLTLRNSINTFNQAVDVNIDTIETNITNLGTQKISSADTGLVFLGGTGVVASLTTAYQKVAMVNSTVIDKSNTHITSNHTTYTYTLNTAGTYKIVFSGGMTAGNGIDVIFNYNINYTIIRQ